MVQYILTGLAGLALGLVIMRVWQMRYAVPDASEGNASEDGAAKPAATAPATSRKLLYGAVAMAALAIAVLALRGTGQTDAPSLAGPAAPSASTDTQLADVDTMIARLAARLEKEPGDGEGWRMLGWSYLMTGRPQQALAPFKRAIELLPAQASAHSGYGEALVGIAGSKVTPEAKAAFDQALRLDPKEPRARFFGGLLLAQNGQGRAALEQWIELSNSAPADAPWQAEVQAKISGEATKQGVDVSGRLKAPAAAPAPVGGVPQPDPAKAAAISALPPAQQQATIEGMVGGLAERLKANPKDAKGWAMLLRSRMVLKQDRQAAADLAAARSALAADPAGLAAVNAAAKDVGVPGA